MKVPDPTIDIPIPEKAIWQHGVVPLGVTEPGENGTPRQTIKRYIVLRLARKGASLSVTLDPDDIEALANDLLNDVREARTGLVVAGAMETVPPIGNPRR